MRIFHRCVVWTGDLRVFFYNPTARQSTWERPDDLKGRSDVDKMLSNPPDAGGTKKKAEPDVEEEPKAKKTKK